MTLVGAGLAGSAVALIVAGTAAGVVAWAGPVDCPRERGSHHSPTPTAGGLGIVAGASLGLLTFALFAPAPMADIGKIAAALGLAAGLGLIGALDDLLDLGARFKFLVQIAFALIFAVFVARIEAIPLAGGLSLPLGPIMGALGTAMWLLVVVNAINFMDGANGLGPGAAIIVLLAFAFAAFAGGAPACGGAALTAAMAGAGFLPWNFPKARLFQGDAGALFSGFLIAQLAVIGGEPGGRGPVYIFFAPLALLPFLADVLLTLLIRAKRRRPLFDAHKDHLYQQWLARHGRSHVALALRVLGAMVAFALGAIALRTLDPALQLCGFAFAVVIAVAAWVWLTRLDGLSPARDKP